MEVDIMDSQLAIGVKGYYSELVWLPIYPLDLEDIEYAYCCISEVCARAEIWFFGVQSHRVEVGRVVDLQNDRLT